MKKKQIMSFIIFSFSLGLLFYKVGVVHSNGISFQDEEAPQIEAKGYIGTNYAIKASNIVVHLKDVSKLDIWKASTASVYSTSSQEDVPEKLTPFIKSTTIKEKVGVYTAELGIAEDSTVQKIISIFVIDDNSIMDDKTLLMGHDIQLSKEQKSTINSDSVKEISQVHAYDLITGMDITPEVKVNTKDLELYLTENNRIVPIKFSVRKITLKIDASTLITSNSVFEESAFINGESDNLPNTGEQNKNILFFLGIFFLVSSCGFVVLKFLSKKRLKDERRDNDKK